MTRVLRAALLAALFFALSLITPPEPSPVPDGNGASTSRRVRRWYDWLQISGFLALAGASLIFMLGPAAGVLLDANPAVVQGGALETAAFTLSASLVCAVFLFIRTGPKSARTATRGQKLTLLAILIPLVLLLPSQGPWIRILAIIAIAPLTMLSIYADERAARRGGNGSSMPSG